MGVGVLTTYMTTDASFKVPKGDWSSKHGDDLYSHVYEAGSLRNGQGYAICGRRLYRFKGRYWINSKGLCDKCDRIYRGLWRIYGARVMETGPPVVLADCCVTGIDKATWGLKCS